jgi:hypothetical protein
MVQDLWITARQAERIAVMVAGGGTLDDALTTLPILATRDLKKAMGPKPKKSGRTPLPTKQPPKAPPPIPVEELDPDLMTGDEDGVDTGEFEALSDETGLTEDSRLTDSAIIKPPATLLTRDPRELISLTVQEPAGSMLPGEESEETAEITALGDDFDLDMEDFDFGDSSAEHADLDDDLILPDEETITEFPAGIAGPSISDTDVSSLLDDVFDSGDTNPLPSFAADAPTPSTLLLPINPSDYVKGKAPQVIDLATNSGDSTMSMIYDLLGESLVLGRRGLRLDLTKQRQNVALYDPDGKLEEERTLSSDVLATVAMKAKQLARLLPHVSEVQKGYCRLEFQGEHARGLVETNGAEPGRDVITVYLIAE